MEGHYTLSRMTIDFTSIYSQIYKIKWKCCSGNSFFYWDIIYFNTDLHNEDNGGIGSAKAVFCQTGEFR